MKKIMLALASAALITVAQNPVALASDNYGTITVRGYAQDTYTANQAIVMVTNSTEKDTLSEAKAENDRVSAQFRDDLRTLGILDKDIKTTNYQTNERERQVGNPDNREYKKTYVVTNALQVTVNDRAKTSQVIDKATAAGIKNVRLAKLDLKTAEKTAQEQDLLIKASKDARQKADALAAALGTRVLGVESFNVDNYGNVMPRMSTMKLYADAAGSGSSVEYGDDTEDMYVNVVFKVK